VCASWVPTPPRAILDPADRAVLSVDAAVAIAMLVGLVGTVLPFLPGLPVILVSTLVWVIADGSDAGQWWVFGFVAAVCIAGMVIGSILPARRAARAGASRWVLVGGAIGLVVGAIVIPVVGAVVGWPLGIFVASMTTTHDLDAAWAQTRATIAGVGIGTAVQLGAGVVAVAGWAVAAWRW
jgi:uncharacterized protein YqgC (DUF456 family)